MKKFLSAALLLSAATVLFNACKKEAKEAAPVNEVSKATLTQIANLGFSTENVHKVDNGYLVEGDIILTEENLNAPSPSPSLIIAQEEQYRTTNLVKGLPRTITISVTNLPTVYSNAANDAINRYNAQNLQIKFQRVSSGGAIDIIGFNEGPSGGYITLGSSGFPTSSGNPYSQIKMNTNQYAYGTNPDQGYIASVIQHEIGHCIGFRHTDYMNRAYSCGGRRSNEGSAGIGAIRIPGTPSKADAGSFMLACSDGSDRSFNANDIIALNYLY